MGADTQYFRTEKRGNVHLVTLDNPPYNAGHADLFEAGAEAMEALGSDTETRAIVLTGAGENFTRGMDVKVAGALDEAGRVRTRAVLNRFCAVLHGLPCAFVCAVNGHTIGAGGIITLCADWVVAAGGDYKIGLPEAKAGLAFPTVPQAITDHWLDPVWRRRVVVTSQLFSPSEAIATGLVDEVVPAGDLIESALARADAMASQAAFRDCKRQLRAKANAEITALLG